MASSAAELLKGRARTAGSAEAYGQACGTPETNGEQMQSRAVAPPEKLD
jgi:hypothetical protein